MQNTQVRKSSFWYKREKYQTKFRAWSFLKARQSIFLKMPTTWPTQKKQASEIKFFHPKEAFCVEIVCVGEPGAKIECLLSSRDKPRHLGNQSKTTATAFKGN